MLQTSRGRTPILFAIGVVWVAGACEPSDQLLRPNRSNSAVSALLTTTAAKSLGPDGRFILGIPTGTHPDIITAEHARRLALAYVRTYGQTFHAAWEHQRGGKIDLSTLAASPRVYFADTPYESPGKDAHPAIRKLVGPWYLVTLVSGETPVIQFAISALNTDVSIDRSGNLTEPRISGNDFRHTGIPIARGVYAFPSPEEAVELAATAAGALVAAPPTLVLTGVENSALLAAWRVQLDRQVTALLSATNRQRDVSVVYVSPRQATRLSVPADEQPGTSRVAVPRDRRAGIAAMRILIPVRPGEATRFEAVSFQGGE